MNFKHYKIQIIIRLALLVVFLTGLIYLLLIQHDYIKSFFLLTACIITLISLFFYIDKRNSDVSNFLEAILSNDFSNKYSTNVNKGKSFQRMYQAFNGVNQKLNNLSIERESQFLYIHTLVKQIQTGIIAFDKKEKVNLVNDSLLETLKLKRINQLKDLKQSSQKLYELCNQILPGQSKLIKITIDRQVKQLTIKASEFILRGKYFKLISIQNIKGELDQHEIDAWQKLIRVLTHEIMNSIAPITSLSGTLRQVVGQQQSSFSDEQFGKNLLDGLEAINNRGKGLMNFTKNYRELTRIPLPVIQPIEASKFFEEIHTLFTSTVKKEDLIIQFDIDSTVERIAIDRELISQAMINLLKNAKEAIEDSQTVNGKIEVTVEQKSSEKVLISITNNGSQINEEVMEQIFIPFYTSKENGSGIGLSIVQQIIQLHGGSITVENTANGVCFLVTL